MKIPLKNLFGNKQEPPKIQKSPGPVASQSKDIEYYKRGDVIGGNYDVLDILGKGGFGIVYLVRSRQTGEGLALKTFRDELLADSAAKEAFKKEALLWVNLERHPFILTAAWVDEVFGRLFVVMEHLAADSLGRVSLADHLDRANSPLEVNQTLKWAMQFCLGMEHARTKGVACHRDIKPANILIKQDGTLKISDFGLAEAAIKAWSGTNAQRGSLVTGGPEGGFGFSLMHAEGKVRCGTPGYIAPEVYRCEGADIRSDIYSFGLVLWQMGNGSHVPPFLVQWRGDMDRFLRETYEQQVSGRIPPVAGPLGDIVKRCLKPNTSDRYGSFRELYGDLSRIWIERTGRKFEIPQIGEGSAAFWSSKGQSLSTLGRNEEAIECFDKALVIDLEYSKAWSGKAAALDGLGRFNEAIGCYDRALAIEPQNSIHWINKGFPLGRLGRHVEAIACYDKALVIDPQKANAWMGKGVALKLLGRHSEAIICYDRALTIDPRNAHAWNNKSNALRALKLIKEATECLDKALAIDPHFSDAWYNRGSMLELLGQHEEAIGCYDKVLVINPRYAPAWEKKGNALYALGRYVEAIASYDKALAIDPRELYTWNNKGGVLAALGRHDDALECHNKALSIDSNNLDGWQSKGNALTALGRFKEAVDCFNLALNIDPKNADSWSGVGNAFSAQGQLKAAVACYDKALECAPQRANTWYNKAKAEDLLQLPSEASVSYQNFIKLAPQQCVQQIEHARQRIKELGRV